MLSKTYEKIELLRGPVEGITIKVRDPSQEAGGNYTTYMITGSDKLGSFEMKRRFNDFFLLRQGLLRTLPGLYVPPIPDKKMIGNKDDRFIEERRRFLEYFCQQVAKVSYLYYSEIFQQFIRNKTLQLETVNGQIERTPTIEKLALLRQLFEESVNKQPVNELNSRLLHFNIYLKKSEKEIEDLRDRAKDIAHAYKIFNTAFNTCSTLILPDYEKNVFKEYIEDETAESPFQHNNLVGEKARLYRDTSEVNPLDHIVDYLTYEHRETIALQQSIHIKQQLENKKRKLAEKRVSEQSELTKLLSGKTTFKSFFTRGNKNEQITALEKSVADDAKEIENLENLSSIVTVVLSREIQNYKTDKQVQYMNLLRRVAQLENERLDVYGDLIKAISVARKTITVNDQQS